MSSVLSEPARGRSCCAPREVLRAGLDRTQLAADGQGRGQTMTHDYKRHGTTTLFAALTSSPASSSASAASPPPSGILHSSHHHRQVPKDLQST